MNNERKITEKVDGRKKENARKKMDNERKKLDNGRNGRKWVTEEKKEAESG